MMGIAPDGEGTYCMLTLLFNEIEERKLITV